MSSGSDSAAALRLETMTGVSCWTVCSVGMMVFNKLAIQHFPLECTLVAVQMAVTVLAMVVFWWNSIHIGSVQDALRWSMVVPFFMGMLLTGMLALKYAPMTLVITFRVLSPIVSLGIERFYPNPIRISMQMIVSILVMFVGAALYTVGMPLDHLQGIGWVILNVFLAVGDRLLQRLMLARDQSPVDISKTGVTLLNNLLGLVPLVVVAMIQGEFAQAPAAFANLSVQGWVWLVLSCVVGVGISYTGIWAQSLIPATTFLVLVNANKFVIILAEATVLKTKALSRFQIVGATTAVIGGILYAKAREMMEAQEDKARTMASQTTLGDGGGAVKGQYGAVVPGESAA